ncbi:AAA family ATPase [Virgibacillus salarius]|uniref:AAA family ATPase n=1 Tax=Virgibacillus salarius TaxID=447199 RepID=UPI0024921152|nr:AAA family ATPase [Virgibacillus salarius]WBX80135.1 AAA family ATPase [Virgibacillus salarius]
MGRRHIKNISVSNFKSIDKEITLDLKPLTILSGTNSSGKSSFMQPLLLMKQTLEESFDPGALLLSGSNVRFLHSDELLHKKITGEKADYFTAGFELNDGEKVKVKFAKGKTGFVIESVEYTMDLFKFDKKGNKVEKLTSFILKPKTLEEELINYIPSFFHGFREDKNMNFAFKVRRSRCFLKIVISVDKETHVVTEFPTDQFEKNLRSIIHLPGLRGNPERNYPTTSVDSESEDLFLPGTFEKYVASIINQWQNSDVEKISELTRYLQKLCLTNKVRAKKINDTQVSINIGRKITKDENDYVNIADVGLGVSQTLPLVVALVFAKPGQLVYIEQPEIHLHPNAQYALAGIICEVANKGVRVVCETHSSLLLKGIQTMVAKKQISNSKVKLHWFSQNKLGATEVNSATLDENGAFGDWPMDFDSVEMNAENDYLDAVEKNMWSD